MTESGLKTWDLKPSYNTYYLGELGSSLSFPCVLRGWPRITASGRTLPASPQQVTGGQLISVSPLIRLKRRRQTPSLRN